MKKENEKIIGEFLRHSGELSEEIETETEALLGTVPFIFGILRERPEAFVLSAMGDYLMHRPPNLDPKTAELIAIAASAAAGADNCLKTHIGAARRTGATRDEILDTLLLTSIIGKTKMLASSLRVFSAVFEADTDAAGGEKKTDGKNPGEATPER